MLDAAGASFGDVVKTTIFLADIGDFAAVNAVYASHMPDPPPARSTFAVGALPKAALVEIEMIAQRPAAGSGGRSGGTARRWRPAAPMSVTIAAPTATIASAATPTITSGLVPPPAAASPSTTTSPRTRGSPPT